MTVGILHVCLSRGWGGLEQYPLSLAPFFIEQDVSVHYWALEDSRFAQAASEKSLSLMTFKSRMCVLFKILYLSRWLRNKNIQIVHFHKSTDLRLALLIGWVLPNIRLVFTEHMNAKKDKKSPYHRLVYGRLDQVISISDFTLDNNRRALPVTSDKICRLYSGVDLQRFHPSLTLAERNQIRQSLGLSPDTVALCLPGRLSPGKGHEVFVEAIAVLNRSADLSRPVHAFVIGGLTSAEGADESFVTQLKQKVLDFGLSEKLTFTGYTSEIQLFLQAMDIVCIPSRLEAFGLAVVEAMALGVPVVGSNSGAIPEILGRGGEYGLLATPDDAESFAACFERLIENDGFRETIGKQALQQVHRNFDLRRHVERLLEIYRI